MTTAEEPTAEATNDETAVVAGSPDPLTRATTTLASIDTLPLERHPEAFSTFDELLREALDSPPHVSSG
jgi:hypothetical protein